MSVARSIYLFGEFALAPDQRRLSHHDQTVELQPKAYETLLYLLRHADRVVSKDELLEHVWPGVIVTDNVLARVISLLRRALDDTPKASRYIRAIPRVGYRMVADVSVTERVASTAREANRALAVLPFRTLSQSDRDESLEMGMADTLISRLSNLRGLIVRPLSAVREFAGQEQDLLAVARHLQAGVCLEGSIQKQGDRVRISARLLSVEDQATLWSDTFDERVSDLLDLQDAICERIVGRLAPQLDRSHVARRHTSPEAYQAYLEGRLFMGRHTPADIQRGMSRFEMALDEDPAYAPAWAGIAECHELLGTLGDATEHQFNAARRASRRALALDPRLSEAQGILAKIAWQFDWDWTGAEAMFEAALGRSPNRADLHIAFADFCSNLARPRRAVEHARKALVIDPISPWVNALLAQALYMSDQYDAAIEQATRTLELAPGFAFAHLFRGLALFRKGARTECFADLQQAVASGRQDFAAALGMCYGFAGRDAEAEQILAGMQQAGEGVPPIAPGMVHLSLGRVDEALAAFEQSVAARDWHVLLILSDPMLAECRELPELRAFLARLNLPAPETDA